ncbi:MAG: hypothetical protein BroJett030_28810 [Alphaproteobacteria bacterium]|nr:MAG: hypothetical protein BroJett030_28810 [Alphaproteobacteria bacterium]
MAAAVKTLLGRTDACAFPRGSAVQVGLLALVVVVAGCTDSDWRRYNGLGIGVRLPTEDHALRSRALQIYFGLLCTDAGLLEQPQASAQYAYCPANLSNEQWKQVVIAGINDINSRCDLYLAWLDNQRRTRGPIHHQLTSIDKFVQALLGFANVGNEAILVVGQAFGLADASLNNYYRAIDPDIEFSSIQTLILSRQKKFVDEFRGETVYGRADAQYRLRNYLILCTPFTVKTEINDLITATARGVTTDEDRNGKSIALITGGLSPSSPLPPEPGPKEALINPLSAVERTLSLRDAMNIQNALCLAAIDGDFGRQGSNTRAALKEFEAIWYGPSQANGIIDTTRERNDLRNVMRTLTNAAAAPSCRQAGFLSPYEVGFFLKGTSVVSTFSKDLAAVFNQSQDRRDKAVAAGIDLAKLEGNNAINPDLRKAVTLANDILLIKDEKLQQNRATVTPGLVKEIAKAVE